MKKILPGWIVTLKASSDLDITEPLQVLLSLPSPAVNRYQGISTETGCVYTFRDTDVKGVPVYRKCDSAAQRAAIAQGRYLAAKSYLQAQVKESGDYTFAELVSWVNAYAYWLRKHDADFSLYAFDATALAFEAIKQRKTIRGANYCYRVNKAMKAFVRKSLNRFLLSAKDKRTSGAATGTALQYFASQRKS